MFNLLSAVSVGLSSFIMITHGSPLLLCFENPLKRRGNQEFCILCLMFAWLRQRAADHAPHQTLSRKTIKIVGIRISQ